MIISDGITDLTFTGSQVDDSIEIDSSSRRSAGGRLKSATSGRRYSVVEKIRITGSELESLTAMLANGSIAYYYTPSITPDYLTDANFPMEVVIPNVKKTRQAGGGDKKYYVELTIEGADYL